MTTKTSPLSEAQRKAIHHAWTDRDGTLRLDTSVCGSKTRKALERKGIVEEWSYVLTNYGREIFEASCG